METERDWNNMAEDDKSTNEGISDDRRESVLDRDGYQCQECGCDVVPERGKDDPVAHVHHQTKISKGGSDNMSNLTTLCPSCHDGKHPSTGVGYYKNRNLYDKPNDMYLSTMDRQILNAAMNPTGLSDIADETDYEYESIQANLSRLIQHTWLKRVERGVYETIPDEIPSEESS